MARPLQLMPRDFAVGVGLRLYHASGDFDGVKAFGNQSHGESCGDVLHT